MLNNKVFSSNGFNDSFLPFKRLKLELNNFGYEINTIDLIKDLSKIKIVICLRYEFNLSILFDILRVNKNVKIMVLATEEISVAVTQNKFFYKCGLFDRVLTWRDNDIDNQFFFKFFYMTPKREFNYVEKRKKLICIINSFKKNTFNHPNNIYKERLKIIDFFDNKKGFSLYGFGWKNYRKNLKSYKGNIQKKIEVYNEYDYAFAIENSNNELGGVSEKIFDIMASGCIPIYYGSPNIQELIPSNCFIDYRRFNSINSLYSHLLSISEGEKEQYRSTIKKFLNSKSYEKFNSIGFSKLMLRNVNELHDTKYFKKSIFEIKKNLFETAIKFRLNPFKNRKFYLGLFQ